MLGVIKKVISISDPGQLHNFYNIYNELIGINDSSLVTALSTSIIFA
jgi:hypothetical protein